MLFFTYLVLAGLAARALAAEPLVPTKPLLWNSTVQEFRRNHHLAFIFASTQGTWQYQQLATEDKQTYSTAGVAAKFEYSFRIPFNSGSPFGYLLGSSCGFNYEDTRGSTNLEVGQVWRLPGALAGIVWNLNPQWSFLLTVEHYLERLEGFSESGSEVPVRLKTTMQPSYDLGYAVELYSALFWGARFELHQRKILYATPPDLLGADVENVKMSKRDQWLGIGVVYHLL